MPIELDELRKLPIADKLHIIEELWDDIASSGEQIPLQPDSRHEVQRRAEELERNPGIALSRKELWKQVDEGP